MYSIGSDEMNQIDESEGYESESQGSVSSANHSTSHTIPFSRLSTSSAERQLSSYEAAFSPVDILNVNESMEKQFLIEKPTKDDASFSHALVSFQPRSSCVFTECAIIEKDKNESILGRVSHFFKNAQLKWFMKNFPFAGSPRLVQVSRVGSLRQG
jgi:hypothetical protein